MEYHQPDAAAAVYLLEDALICVFRSRRELVRSFSCPFIDCNPFLMQFADANKNNWISFFRQLPYFSSIVLGEALFCLAILSSNCYSRSAQKHNTQTCSSNKLALSAATNCTSQHSRLCITHTLPCLFKGFSVDKNCFTDSFAAKSTPHKSIKFHDENKSLGNLLHRHRDEIRVSFLAISAHQK